MQDVKCEEMALLFSRLVSVLFMLENHCICPNKYKPNNATVYVCKNLMYFKKINGACCDRLIVLVFNHLSGFRQY